MKPYQFIAIIFMLLLLDDVPLTMGNDTAGFYLKSSAAVFVLGALFYELWLFFRPCLIRDEPAPREGGSHE